MEVFEFNCRRCGKFQSLQEMPTRGELCFGCHVKGINLGFRYGKDNFHGPTIRERQEKILSDAKAAGIDAAPAKDFGF